MNDLVDRLRRYKRDRSGYAEYCHQAADAIDRKDAAIAELVAALRSALDSMYQSSYHPLKTAPMNILEDALAKYDTPKATT